MGTELIAIGSSEVIDKEVSYDDQQHWCDESW